MVYHGFKGDEETDRILSEVPKTKKSNFIKQAVKSYTPQTQVKELPKMPEKIPTVRIRV